MKLSRCSSRSNFFFLLTSSSVLVIPAPSLIPHFPHSRFNCFPESRRCRCSLPGFFFPPSAENVLRPEPVLFGPPRRFRFLSSPCQPVLATALIYIPTFRSRYCVYVRQCIRPRDISTAKTARDKRALLNSDCRPSQPTWMGYVASVLHSMLLPMPGALGSTQGR